MADQKVSKLMIIEANLACEKCYKKLQKVLCKLQEKENIKSINFDTDSNTVTISGPFDAVRLERKLRCKAREAIKDIKKEQKKEEKKEEKPKAKKEEEKPEKKPEEKKSDEKPKPKDQSKAAAAPPPPSSTTVNLQFTQMCNLCYPWPCSDPSHRGSFHQNPQPCEGMPPPVLPGHHQQCPPCAPVTPKRPCGGPSYCGGCGSCGGGGGGGMQGWPPVMPTPIQMMQPPPMCSTGPASCRGCKGCRIVQEGRFIYEEYPPSLCAVM